MHMHIDTVYFHFFFLKDAYVIQVVETNKNSIKKFSYSNNNIRKIC